jgi:hypothetical protein
MIYKKLHIKLKIDQSESTKQLGWIQVLRKDMQLLLHMCHLSCYSDNKYGDKS